MRSAGTPSATRKSTTAVARASLMAWFVSGEPTRLAWPTTTRRFFGFAFIQAAVSVRWVRCSSPIRAEPLSNEYSLWNATLVAGSVDGVDSVVAGSVAGVDSVVAGSVTFGSTFLGRLGRFATATGVFSGVFSICFGFGCATGLAAAAGAVAPPPAEIARALTWIGPTAFGARCSEVPRARRASRLARACLTLAPFTLIFTPQASADWTSGTRIAPAAARTMIKRDICFPPRSELPPRPSRKFYAQSLHPATTALVGAAARDVAAAPTWLRDGARLAVRPDDADLAGRLAPLQLRRQLRRRRHRGAVHLRDDAARRDARLGERARGLQHERASAHLRHVPGELRERRDDLAAGRVHRGRVLLHQRPERVVADVVAHEHQELAAAALGVVLLPPPVGALRRHRRAAGGAERLGGRLPRRPHRRPRVLELLALDLLARRLQRLERLEARGLERAP